ncbi:MAG: DUF2975 domain-containing protein [Phycicoccus sp.]|nr:DUF2975 domain-containing protein [Phycicoccus sp.]
MGRSLGKRNWLAFSRADFIATEIFLGIAVAGAVLFGLAGPLLDAVTGTPLEMSYTTAVNGGIELPRGATHNGKATMPLLLNDATFVERLGQALPGLMVAVMTIAIAWLILHLLRSTQAQEPFTTANVKRINTIALAIGLGGMLWQLATAFADNAIYTTGRVPDLDYLPFEATFSPFPLFAMFVIALIAEAFRRGVILRNDVEGLV